MLHGQISGSSLSEQYFQRLPIRYRRIGRTRVYEFDDIVAYVKELRAGAPRKNAGAEEASSSPTGACLTKRPPCVAGASRLGEPIRRLAKNVGRITEIRTPRHRHGNSFLRWRVPWFDLLLAPTLRMQTTLA